MKNANPPSNNRPLLTAALRTRAVQELHEQQIISAFVDSRLESIERFLNNFANHPNETDMNNLESDDESVDTPLVSPFPHSDNDSDDGEVLNELIEYENVGMLRRERAINSFDGDDLAFQCMIGFRKFVAYFDTFLPMNIITRKAYNTIMVEELESTRKNLVAIVRDVYVFVGSFTYITDFVVLEDIGEFILINKVEVVMGKPFKKITKIEYDCAKGLMSFNRIFDNYTFQMPRTILRFKRWGHVSWSKIPPILSIFSLCYLFRNSFSSTTMGDANLIRTLGDYSKPSHEGYKNTIELLVGNNVVPLRSDTIRLVQNGCSFHRLRFEDPNQHLKDFLKLVDLLDLDGENRERTRLRLFQFSLRDQDSNWLECLPAGSITTWEDLTTSFLAQFFPPGRTAKLRNDILMFQQHQGDSLSKAWTHFKDLLQKVPHHGIDLWLQIQIFYDHANPDLALYENESWNDPRDFAKPVKAISLPQDVLSTSYRRLIELENQVQRLMEAHLALMQPSQVNKITSSCEICSGPHDTQYCMEDPKQAFVEYASSHTDEA
ncbi:MAK10-like protein [Tanacetum coccineum]